MILEIALAVTLQDIVWLTGEWQIASPNQCVEEQWTLLRATCSSA